MTLCKFHHMEKSRMGRDLFKTFIQLVRTNSEIKKKPQLEEVTMKQPLK